MLHIILLINYKNRKKKKGKTTVINCSVGLSNSAAFSLRICFRTDVALHSCIAVPFHRADAQPQNHTGFAQQRLMTALTPSACKISPWEGDRAGNHILLLLKPWWRCPEQAPPPHSTISSCSGKPPHNTGAVGKEKQHGRLEMDQRVLSAIPATHTHTLLRRSTYLQNFIKLGSGSYFLAQKHPLRNTAKLRDLPALLIFHFLDKSVAF